MFARLALLFIVVPIIELALLIQMGQWVGVWPTVGLVIFTGVLGAAIARAEGLRTLRAFQQELATGRIPETAILDGLSILVGGALLLTPGLLTDVLGFSLLIPGSRRVIRSLLRRRVEAQMRSGSLRVEMWSAGTGFGRGFETGDVSGGVPEGDADRKLDPRHEIRTDEPDL